MTDLHLPTFFAYVRRAPFGGRLTQLQVDGLNAVLEAGRELTDDRHLAYIIATAFHETGGKMQPVREGFARTDAGARRAVAGRRYAKVDAETGHVFYGRGLVQLTWKSNYRKMGEALGIDLVNEPDRMLEMGPSAQALVRGMRDGMFTTKRLDQYFNATTDDPEGARRIVNGTDKASLIAGYHRAFLDSIKAAKEAARGPAPAVVEEQAKPDGADLKKDPVAIGGVMAGAGALGGMLTYAKPVLESVNSPWAFAFALIIALGVFLVLTGRVQLKRTGGV